VRRTRGAGGTEVTGDRSRAPAGREELYRRGAEGDRREGDGGRREAGRDPERLTSTPVPLSTWRRLLVLHCRFPGAGFLSSNICSHEERVDEEPQCLAG